MRIIVIFDDTGRKSEIITDIIGAKGFADVVVKKRRLEEYYRDVIENIFPNLIWRKICSFFEYPDCMKELEIYNSSDCCVLHCFSNYWISDASKAELSFRKLEFIDEPYRLLDGKRIVAAMFPSVSAYLEFCRNVVAGQKARDLAKNMEESCEIEGLVDIGIVGNFIQCITGNFDSRYFNSFSSNEYTLIKSSANKRKIKAEYNFYNLIPEDMRYWFVMPFNYQETDSSASYTMERLHMTDLAIKWVHGSIDEAEFEELMDKYFYFFSIRHARKCSETEYRKTADALYIDKVVDRISDFKKMPEYMQIKRMLEISGEVSVDSLLDQYFALKDKVENMVQYNNLVVIGHGDPCFANALYNKSARILKFIDPKGAITEDELWTDPYYDIAKLSHSVCGRYDFFNNGIFDIKVNTDLGFDLEIPFDNSKYVEIFKRMTKENGFDYLSVRVYEASLFLSMLPLHIDSPYKVFGFILNVQNILKEIEKDV